MPRAVPISHSRDPVESCTGKEAFAKAEDVRKAARSMKRRGKPVRVYRCPHCMSWHMGRSSTQ